MLVNKLYLTCCSCSLHACSLNCASRQGCARVCGVQAGVRSLSRSLAAVCRHVAVQIVSEQDHAQAQPHQEPQGSSDSISSKQQSRSAHPQSPTHIQQQQQQQEVSCVRKPQDMHATSDQPCQSAHADLDTTALESSAAASAGPFFWGSLWGGLRGAFSPPRQRPRDVKRRCEAPHQQVSRHPGHSHLHPAHLQTSHAVHAEHEHADANNASRQPHQHCINRAIFPAVLAPVPGTAGSKALLASTGGFTTSAGEGHHQGQASSLCFGVNADMVKPAHSEVGLLTVTAELIEEVLGPRKYNETDSADYLVAPGDLQMASCVPHVSATRNQTSQNRTSSVGPQLAPRTQDVTCNT